ncbi:hypothetical protein [Butyrivibrio sp. WCE2006]|uniref:hypothetical protein n=1 Tax=Butyrivibrio sp. WCE2006 TaxID=1410611 RepID=UPI0005D1CCFB|nr:hypothetical protein [Butyrivibrio sp. WCE2006]
MNQGKDRLFKKNNIVIALEIVLIIVLLLCVGYAFWNSKTVQFTATDMQILTKDSGVDFSIQNVSKFKQKSSDYIDIKGWVVEKNIESKGTDKIKVVLKNTDTGIYYLIPTIRQMRKDVTYYFYDGTKYDESGFEAKVRFSEDINTDLNEYEIFIYLENEAGKKLISTENKFNEWIANHQQ